MKTTFCGWRILISALVFAAWAAAFSAKAEAGDPVNLAEYLAAELGKTQSALAQECVTGIDDGTHLAKFAFDGIYYVGASINNAWLSTLAKEPYLQFAIPSTSRVTGFVLTSYNVRRMCQGYNSKDRAPTAWTLEGSNDGVTWEPIDSRNDVTWEGSQTSSRGGSNPKEADCLKTFTLGSVPAAYSRFRFTPTARSATWEGTASTLDIGLHELEFFGVPQIAELQVFHGIDKVEDTSVFPVGDGEYVAAAGTITAPAAVYRLCGLRYRPIGYALEEVESGTVTTNLESTAYDYVPNGKLRCLTWLWAFAGMSESVNYHTIATTYGGEVSYEGGTSGKDYAANMGPDRCFDGTTLTDNANLRYTGKVNSHVALMVTGLKLEDEVKLVPVSYRLWQQSTGYYCNERAPTGWRLEGSNDGGSTWEVIDEVSDYTWYSQTNLAVYGTGQQAKSPWEKDHDGEKNSATFEIEEGEPFLSYRLVFTGAKYMEGYTSQQTSGWDAGLMEIEPKFGSWMTRIAV